MPPRSARRMRHGSIRRRCAEASAPCQRFCTVSALLCRSARLSPRVVRMPPAEPHHARAHTAAKTHNATAPMRNRVIGVRARMVWLRRRHALDAADRGAVSRLCAAHNKRLARSARRRCSPRSGAVQRRRSLMDSARRRTARRSGRSAGAAAERAARRGGRCYTPAAEPATGAPRGDGGCPYHPIVTPTHIMRAILPAAGTLLLGSVCRSWSPSSSACAHTTRRGRRR